jgi:hypothetical protein
VIHAGSAACRHRTRRHRAYEVPVGRVPRAKQIVASGPAAGQSPASSVAKNIAMPPPRSSRPRIAARRK